MNFVFVTKSFVSVLSTLLIFTQHIISSLTMFPSALIRLSLLCSLDILTLLYFNRSLERRGSDPFDVPRESFCALNRLLNACSSIDIWRYLHPTSSSYTWTRSNGSLSSRFDFIIVPYVWVPSVSSCDIVACPFCDHCAVVMSVRVPEVPTHGPGPEFGSSI